MKITCPMCDANSVPKTELEIVLDCDWCRGRGWIDESEHRFYADEGFDAVAENRKVHQQSVLVKKWCLLSNKRVYSSTLP